MKLIVVEYNPGSAMQNFIFNTEEKDFFKKLKDGIKYITNDDILINKSALVDEKNMQNIVSELLNNWNEYLVFTVS